MAGDRTDGDHEPFDVRIEAFQHLQRAVAVTDGPDHRFVAANHALIEFFGGIDPVGLTIRDLVVGAEGQGLVQLYEEAFRSGRSLTGHRTRFQFLTADGLEQESFIDFDVTPRHGPAGEVVGLIAQGTIVTDQVRRERQQEAEARDLTRRYRRATDVVEELQRALLPESLPFHPGLDLAATYLVGGIEQAAGGDWFDVVVRPDGAVVMVVGDVVGHGVAAAATMAKMRAVALDHIVAGEPIDAVVSALDRFVEVVPRGRSATVCVVDLDPASGVAHHCSAGHPPPLLTSARGNSRYLDPSEEPPLGGSPTRTRRAAELAHDEVLVLYTDGIIERPGIDPSRATVDLARVAADAAADRLFPIGSPTSVAERTTSQVLEVLSRTGTTDDVTILAAHRSEPLPRLALDLAAAHASSTIARGALREWLASGRAAPDRIGDVEQVVTELIANVADHAYGTAGGSVTVAAEVDVVGDLTVTVADHGTWRPPDRAVNGRGLGLALAAGVADDLRVDHDDRGTRTTFRLRLRRSISVAGTPHQPESSTDTFDVIPNTTAAGSELHLVGALDASAEADLDAHLMLTTAPGSPPLTIFFDEATLVASAAIATLIRALDRARRADVGVTVVARPGTAAHRALTLVGIPTTAPGDPASP